MGGVWTGGAKLDLSWTGLDWLGMNGVITCEVMLSTQSMGILLLELNVRMQV